MAIKWSIPICKSYKALNKFTEENLNSILLSTDNLSERPVSEKRKMAKKPQLHKQFGHSNARETSRLVKTSRIKDK